MAKLVTNERVDDIPVLLNTLQAMNLPKIVNDACPTHGNWSGLPIGETCAVWITHLLSQADHRLSHVQKWAGKHIHTLSLFLGMEVRELDFTDDRLAIILEKLSDDEVWEQIEFRLNKESLRVYEIEDPTVRIDCTTVNSNCLVVKDGLVQLHLGHMSSYLRHFIAILMWCILVPKSGDDVKYLKSAWQKTNEKKLLIDLKEDYGFSKALSRSLVHLMREHIDENYGNLRKDYQVVYHPVSANEPPGKSLDELRKASVSLTVFDTEDERVLRECGPSGLRKHRIVRLTNEAYDQGGLLVQEDLALLLTTSVRSIRRDIKELKEEGITIPTRGAIQDIGPTISHKTQIVELYLKGYEYTDIELRTHHTGDAIKRYIKAFSKVLFLHKSGYSPVEIRELTDLSEKVVSEYLELYNKYEDIGRERISQIMEPIQIEFQKKKGGVGV